ncbi:hypothetical protein ABIC56_003937 [Acinetobacter bereziniae]|uniref:DUF7738 domain-containing protein n=1 Tax=Acinetobacter bereziniae TaxID=106648 RepID=UPI002855268D|nr:hypothetical protein [Acinetobacter bereziniae]MDR6541435.1 hypothetical protein [Acinetobacter bereziniae]
MKRNNSQNKWILFLPLLLCISCSNGQSTTKQDAETEGFIKKINPQHQFKVHGCAINYNGTDLYMSSGVEPWLKVLGKNYRVVETVDPINRINLYIYDDIGVSLMERQVDKKISMFGFYLPNPAHSIDLIETPQSIENKKLIGDESPKKRFQDAISINDILVGAYPMHDEIRSLFRAKTSVSYAYTADCTEEQKDKGELFYVDLGTSFNEPEVIDNLYFYNYFDIMTLEQKKQLARRTDENGREICGEYVDIKTFDILPNYCTQEELDDEKKQQSK